MITRKKKIFLIQIFLLIIGLIFLFFTYTNFEKNSSKQIFSKKTKSEIDEKLKKNLESGNIFYNIEYAGIDFSGNRYVLKAKEAKNLESEKDIIDLKLVTAVFYFKNGKILNIFSDEGLYNNKNLDIIFKNNVYGDYEDSKLFAGKAEYYNSKNILIVSENVKVKDYRGTIFAEKLFFDINKNTLNITSAENNKIDANINYK